MTRPNSSFKKRGRLTILYEMLTILQAGRVKKTHLMYRANLSHSQLHKFLSVLLDTGLDTEVLGQEITEYRITVKGRRFVTEFQQIQALFDA